MQFLSVIGEAGAAAGRSGGFDSNSIIMIGLIFGIFYFMMIRPQQRKEKERRQMQETLSAGKRVLLTSGFLGTLKEVKTSTLVVTIAKGVDVEVTKSAVTRVLPEGEEAVSEQK